MLTYIFAGLLAAALALVLASAVIRKPAPQRLPARKVTGCSERAPSWLPPELKYASILAVEEDMSGVIDVPKIGLVRFFGRPDQVYRLPNGVCVPVEFKNRDRAQVRQADSDQLALQARLLRQNGHPTASFGVVVLQRWGTGERHPVIVRLAGDEYAEYLVSRYFDLRSGAANPASAKDRRCSQCAHRPACW